jgi:hypothetical protein
MLECRFQNFGGKGRSERFINSFLENGVDTNRMLHNRRILLHPFDNATLDHPATFLLVGRNCQFGFIPTSRRGRYTYEPV